MRLSLTTPRRFIRTLRSLAVFAARDDTHRFNVEAALAAQRAQPAPNQLGAAVVPARRKPLFLVQGDERRERGGGIGLCAAELRQRLLHRRRRADLDAARAEL